MKDRRVQSSNEATSLTLIQRVKEKNEVAWELLVEIYTALVYYWCRRSRLSDSDCEDVVQAVWTKVYQNLSTFEHNGRNGAFRKWLGSIAKNEIVNLMRQQPVATGEGGTVHVQALEAVAENALLEPDETEFAKEKQLLYRRAWQVIEGHFSDRDSRFFRRVVMNEEQPKDVAIDEGVKANVVSVAVSRIKSKIRELLAPDFHE